MGLAEAGLRRGCGHLQPPLGGVLPDRQAGHIPPRVRCGHVPRRRTDDDDELGLPVGVIAQVAVRLDVDGSATRTVDQGEPAVDGGDAHAQSPDADEHAVDTV